MSVGSGWSLAEKQSLLEAIRIHGHSDINILRKAVPTKNRRAIQRYLNHFKKFANADLCSDKTVIVQVSNPRKSYFGKRDLESAESSALCRWIDVFTESSKSLNPTLSVALKLIALLENRSDGKTAPDLKQLYMYLGSALAGEVPEPLDSAHMGILTCALVDLATKTKACRPHRDVEFIQGINRIFKDRPYSMVDNVSNTPVPKAASEVQSSFEYNPLGVSIQALERYPDL